MNLLDWLMTIGAISLAIGGFAVASVALLAYRQSGRKDFRLRLGPITFDHRVFPTRDSAAVTVGRIMAGSNPIPEPGTPAERRAALMQEYHDQGLAQARSSYRFSIAFACIGFAVLVGSAYLFTRAQDVGLRDDLARIDTAYNAQLDDYDAKRRRLDTLPSEIAKQKVAVEVSSAMYQDCKSAAERARSDLSDRRTLLLAAEKTLASIPLKMARPQGEEPMFWPPMNGSLGGGRLQNLASAKSALADITAKFYARGVPVVWNQEPNSAESPIVRDRVVLQELRAAGAAIMKREAAESMGAREVVPGELDPFGVLLIDASLKRLQVLYETLDGAREREDATEAVSRAAAAVKEQEDRLTVYETDLAQGRKTSIVNESDVTRLSQEEANLKLQLPQIDKSLEAKRSERAARQAKGDESRLAVAKQAGAILGAISGVVVETVAGLFFVQSNRARKLMAEFFDRLRQDRRLEESLAQADKIPDPNLRGRLNAALAVAFSGVTLPEVVVRSLVDPSTAASSSEVLPAMPVVTSSVTARNGAVSSITTNANEANR
jgi:hypothetical protein